MADQPPVDVILVMAPIGADAANLQAVLSHAGLATRVCRTDADLRAGIAAGCGAILMTEEALTPELNQSLGEVFDAEPPWSDIPVVLISSIGMAHSGPAAAARLRGSRRTVTLLERPLRAVTLVASLHTVLAARRRQYEMRDLLHERDMLLSSLESRVAERTAELQRMVEEMEAFSYSVSHDLRSPLRSLAGYAQALQEDYAAELPEGARGYLQRIERAARRMDSLTQDVLAYTRVTRCEMQVLPVDLDALFREVIEQYPALGSSANSIRVQAPLGWVMGHVPSLIQCFSNLLGNAVKFVPAGRVPEITVRAEPCGERRRVLVRDNGIGIEAVDQTRIFRMFERAAGKKTPGTGIGLAIVKKAVERMGGSVGVSSRPGEGSEFWIELAAAPSPAMRAENGGEPAAAFWGERKAQPLEAAR